MANDAIGGLFVLRRGRGPHPSSSGVLCGCTRCPSKRKRTEPGSTPFLLQYAWMTCGARRPHGWQPVQGDVLSCHALHQGRFFGFTFSSFVLVLTLKCTSVPVWSLTIRFSTPPCTASNRRRRLSHFRRALAGGPRRDAAAARASHLRLDLGGSLVSALHVASRAAHKWLRSDSRRGNASPLSTPLLPDARWQGLTEGVKGGRGRVRSGKCSSCELTSPGCRPAPLLLLLLQRPLGVLLVEPHALERSLLGESAAVEVEAGVGEPLEELGLQHRQAHDAAALGAPGDVLAALKQAPAVALWVFCLLAPQPSVTSISDAPGPLGATRPYLPVWCSPLSLSSADTLVARSP